MRREVLVTADEAQAAGDSEQESLIFLLTARTGDRAAASLGNQSRIRLNY